MNFNNDPDYEECIVTFIDILGFRDILYSKTAAEVRELLSFFRKETEPDESQDYWSNVRSASAVKTEIVSDAVVRARTIHTDYKAGALFQELLDLVFIHADCIKNGILIRGALTIDNVHVGKQLEGPIFGPGLVKAYQMEEREAVYSRIIVDDEVIDRFRNDKSLWWEGHSQSQEAASVNDLLKSDEAGLNYVDYLGTIKREMEDYAVYLEFLKGHKELIENGSSMGLGRVVRRKYAWLKNYHNRQFSEEMNNPHLDDFCPELEGTLREFLEPLEIA